jgi:predicted house-cleaning NTP pyrophosphatase (Maf/HAM1 superfamily)
MAMVQHGDREALAMDPVGFLPIDLVADAASELAAYVATGEGRGRAGGYAIQGVGA